MTQQTIHRRDGPVLDSTASACPREIAAARRALAIAFGPPEHRGFAVQLWDGSVDGGTGASAPFTFVVRRPGALRRALLPPSELAIVQAYLRDDLDIEGDFESAGIITDLAARHLRTLGAISGLIGALRSLPTDDLRHSNGAPARTSNEFTRLSRHSRSGDAANIRHHYDVGNDFYSLWLDTRMLYSCAYFPTGTEDLDAAQEAKLEHICRKLRLRAGDHLLDVGCGWGALLEYAATRYGVSGVGITLSEPQAELARERLAAAGVGDRVRVEVRDYRDLPPEWRFHKAVSVGMREHVGAGKLPEYYACVFRALEPGGLFLDHGIVRGETFATESPLEWLVSRLWRRDAFIQKYVFPGGELVPLGPLIQCAEGAGFEARDVENLREHYVHTLRHWVARLERAHTQASALVGEHTYRVWRLYMAATSIGFLSGRLTLIQTLLAKPMPSGTVSVPLTREDLYNR